MDNHHIPRDMDSTESQIGLSHQTLEMPIIVTTVTESDNNENDNGKLPDIVAEATTCNETQSEETFLSIAIQVFIPFLIAGFGMVCAGLVLDRIQVTYLI